MYQNLLMKRKINFFYKCFSKLFRWSFLIVRRLIENFHDCKRGIPVLMDPKDQKIWQLCFEMKRHIFYFRFWKFKKWRHSELNPLTTRSECIRMAIILKTWRIFEWNCQTVKHIHSKNNYWKGIQFQVIKMLFKSSLQ